MQNSDQTSHGGQYRSDIMLKERKTDAKDVVNGAGYSKIFQDKNDIIIYLSDFLTNRFLYGRCLVDTDVLFNTQREEKKRKKYKCDRIYDVIKRDKEK